MDNEIQEFNSARPANNNVQAYKFTTLKVRKIVAHITFNKTGINKSLTPKYAQIKIKHNNQAARITQKIAQSTYIKESIKQLYKKKDALNRKALTLHPVSYTHLDVYKRQVLCYSGGLVVVFNLVKIFY